jgi:hypothetical protein
MIQFVQSEVMQAYLGRWQERDVQTYTSILASGKLTDRITAGTK